MLATAYSGTALSGDSASSFFGWTPSGWARNTRFCMKPIIMGT
jgi:hypothetical protein